MTESDNSPRIVVDTSVYRSAHNDDTRENATSCRAFLTVIANERILVVLTPDIENEWRSHDNEYNTNWRTQMIDGRLFCQIQDCRQSALREQMRRHFTDKDAHLFEAALATDREITSTDDRARRGAASASPRIEELGAIVWVNPANDDERPILWLQRRCPNDTERTLSHFRQHRLRSR